jgi:hypothetical protein
MSTFEKLYGRKPSVNKFCPFGCLAYVFQHESKRKKLDSMSIPCILLATLEHGNYRIYDVATKKVYVSRHVVFSGTEFPACILTKKSRGNCMESQSDYSDSCIFLARARTAAPAMTVSSTPNLKETEKCPLMTNKTKTMKKTKMTTKTKTKLIITNKVVLVKAQMMSTPRSAHLLYEA